LPPKVPFFRSSKTQILSKNLPKIPNFAICHHSKIRPPAAVNLLYEVLSKQFQGFGFHFFVKKCELFGKILPKISTFAILSPFETERLL